LTTAVIARVVADQRVRFLLAGAAGAALYYLLFSLGWLACGARVPYPLLALATGTACAVLTYPLYRHLVFRATGPSLRGFWRFYVVCLWSLAVSLGGLSVLVEAVGLHVLLAQALVVVGGPVVNYQVSRLWAFRRREPRGA
jgi:putative flippase GtrA